VAIEPEERDVSSLVRSVEIFALIAIFISAILLLNRAMRTGWISRPLGRVAVAVVALVAALLAAGLGRR
jgi:hypothetical protein